ncbi:hypothetical protein [Amycolatopsis sp. Hca4]|uniref:hypothetical protein n=1 Tax=Amycolatopsis sp. Hca4 TaxID=2742131 RepID=UPI0015924776|nr:hypothetical protein [Amycolatopsis sp. Hca4]QKV74105.1 hypothetical protein HUT10_10245 [Amycolatopsis sp. Hca4]
MAEDLKGMCGPDRLPQARRPPSALMQRGRATATDELKLLASRFGYHNAGVELIDYRQPHDNIHSDHLAALAEAPKL